MSGFEFRKSGDIVYHDERAQAEYWLYLPRIGELRQLDEFSAQMADERADLDGQVQGFRTMWGRQAELAAKTDLTAAERKELADLSKSMNKTAVEGAETLAAFNLRIADDTFRWLRKAVELVGSGWPDDPDDWPAAARMSSLVRQIKEHWANVPLA